MSNHGKHQVPVDYQPVKSRCWRFAIQAIAALTPVGVVLQASGVIS